MDKKDLMKQLQADWEKYWKIDFLIEKGFKRYQCKKCNKFFWSIKKDDTCNDNTCKEKEFLKRKMMNKSYDYFEAWDAIKKFFESKGHHVLERYPTVCRWFPLYFTIAGIVDFYRMDKDKFVFEFPKSPVILLQPSMRFNDIDEVGRSGAHWTCHGHIEQAGTSYWKEEAIKLDFELLTNVFGIPVEELNFIEDAWMGPGAFGYSLEYFVPGIELGNCVFTEFKGTPDKYERLEKPVIDMGAGIERFCWVSQQTPTSYEAVMGPVIENMKNGVKLNDDSVRAIYSIADHARTICFAITDGAVPSNVGGGYNLRILLRRAFGFIEKFNFEFDFKWACRETANFFSPINPELKKNIKNIERVIDIEHTKYKDSKSRMKSILGNIKSVSEDKMIELYDSHGITPEMIKEIIPNLKVPEDFYMKITEKHEMAKPEVIEKPKYDLPKTDTTMVYKKIYEFDAKVLKVDEEKVVLDKTAFYPTGGGQEFDKGTISGHKVYNVINSNGVAVHYVEKPKFKKGDTVECKVDENARAQIIKHHSATHLINLSCQKVLGPHIWQEGSKKDLDKAHLDISHYDTISEKEMKAIEKTANDFIKQKIEIRKEVMSRMEAEQKYGFRIYQGAPVPLPELTIISIDDLEHEACGGLHLDNTSEIEEVHIFRVGKVQDGFYRIEFVAGTKLIKETKEKWKKLRQKEEDELKKKKERIENKKKKLKTIKAKILYGIYYVNTDDIKELEVHGQASIKQDESKWTILVGNGCVYGIKGKDSDYDIESIVKTIGEKLGGRAGGQGNEFRGGGPLKDKGKEIVEEMK
ncbi:MAG: hypothetical protein KJ906_01100 [Nanoarchaeota archaeon]|nr:hypothetical protein [Nanoarchaeota archaeon]